MTAEERMEICRNCPLYEITSSGPRCNPAKYINSEGKTSWLPKKGYVKGCNCLLTHKTQNPNAHCVAGLW